MAQQRKTAESADVPFGPVKKLCNQKISCPIVTKAAFCASHEPWAIFCMAYCILVKQDFSV